MPCPSPFRSSVSLVLGVSLLIGGLLLGCESDAPPSSYVARVGDHYLTSSELDTLLAGMGPLPDSAQARRQVINQWVTRTLLLREADRLNLAQVPEVQRRLEQRRRSTLVTAMTNRIYDDADLEPSDDAIRTYFEQHRQQLRLREPYLQVRYLSTTTRDSAQTVRARLQDLPSSGVDSTWNALVGQYAAAPEQARALSEILPAGRLFSQVPFAEQALESLEEGQLSRVLEEGGRYHVLQLVRRLPEGTDPELRWVRDEIRRRLRIQNRKQMYAREVQRLRNRAQANDALETP